MIHKYAGEMLYGKHFLVFMFAQELNLVPISVECDCIVFTLRQLEAGRVFLAHPAESAPLESQIHTRKGASNSMNLPEGMPTRRSSLTSRSAQTALSQEAKAESVVDLPPFIAADGGSSEPLPAVEPMLANENLDVNSDKGRQGKRGFASARIWRAGSLIITHISAPSMRCVRNLLPSLAQFVLQSTSAVQRSLLEKPLTTFIDCACSQGEVIGDLLLSSTGRRAAAICDFIHSQLANGNSISQDMPAVPRRVSNFVEPVHVYNL